MIPLYEMNIIQIDVTNACMNQCANCTRFCGHHRKSFFMDMETFKKAVDSLVDFPGMVGMIGGEPLLHPQFEEMALYLKEKIADKKRRGLWSTIPQKNSAKYSVLIKDVFGNLFLNDHSINNILHQPILVSADEIIADKKLMWELIDNCWVQTLWSASITPKGTFFCEVAASFDMLFNGTGGWPIEPGWWRREPDDFREQKELWCPRCGCAIPLKRKASVDLVDDVGIQNFEELRKIGSPKISKGLYELYEKGLEKDWNPDPNWYMAKIENEKEYRQNIADRLYK